MIEAWQVPTVWPKAGKGAFPVWLDDAYDDNTIAHPYDDPDVLLIITLEGVMRAEPGDWIIQGAQQELYLCKSDIFEQTYEAIE